MNWTLVTLVAFGLLSVLVWLQRRRTAERVWPAWHAVLGRGELERYEDLQQSLSDTQGILADTLALARVRAEQRDPDDVRRVLGCAADHVERHVPDVAVRLAMWRTMAHAVQALRPLPRLGVLQFRTWHLRGAATLDRVVRVALDTSHRFALRVWVLIRGLGVVRRGFTSAARSRPKQARTTTSASADLSGRIRRMETLNEDLASLHNASLDTYKTLLSSMDQHGRPD